MRYLKKKEGNWDWSKIVAGIVGLMLLPMVGLIYNNMDNAIAENKKADAVLDEKKVDNETLLRYIEVQNIQIKNQTKQTEMLEKKIEKQEVKDTELLKAVHEMNINMVIIQQQLKTKEPQ